MKGYGVKPFSTNPKVLLSTVYRRFENDLVDPMGELTHRMPRFSMRRDFSPGLRFIKQNVPEVEILEYPMRLECCAQACGDKSISDAMTAAKLDKLAEIGADVLVMPCPTCYAQFDLEQLRIAREAGKKWDIPAAHYVELLALAFGFAPEELGLDRHRIKMKNALAKLEVPAAAKTE